MKFLKSIFKSKKKSEPKEVLRNLTSTSFSNSLKNHFNTFNLEDLKSDVTVEGADLIKNKK